MTALSTEGIECVATTDNTFYSFSPTKTFGARKRAGWVEKEMKREALNLPSFHFFGEKQRKRGDFVGWVSEWMSEWERIATKTSLLLLFGLHWCQAGSTHHIIERQRVPGISSHAMRTIPHPTRWKVYECSQSSGHPRLTWQNKIPSLHLSVFPPPAFPPPPPPPPRPATPTRESKLIWQGNLINWNCEQKRERNKTEQERKRRRQTEKERKRQNYPFFSSLTNDDESLIRLREMRFIFTPNEGQIVSILYSVT